MVAVARERIASEGWRNVSVVEAPVEDAQLAVTADAALFLRRARHLAVPGALRNVLGRLGRGRGWLRAAASGPHGGWWG